MTAISTTGTLTAGSSKTFNLAPGSALSLTLSPNVRVTITETPETVSGSGVGGNTTRVHEPQLAGTFAYGPYAMGGVVVVAVASNSGSSVAWTRKDTVVSTSSDGLSLVSGDGTVILPLPINEDLTRTLAAPTLQQVSSGGTPSLLSLTSDQTTIFYWSMSGSTAGQSVVGMVDGICDDGYGVEISALLTTNGGDTTKHHVLKTVVSAMRENQSVVAKQLLGSPYIGSVMASNFTKRVVLESYVPIETDRPIAVRIIRDNADAADDFTSSIGIVLVMVRALKLGDPITVQEVVAYNSWPFLAESGGRLVCMYSKGATHDLPDTTRKVVCKLSSDGGVTWGGESTIADTASTDDAAIGRGLDSSGRLLLWVRRNGLEAGRTFHLYKSSDGGATWGLFSSPTFGTNPLQITDIFTVPTVGLMAFYHAGTYVDGAAAKSWGIVKSTDDGLTWTQVAAETGLTAYSAWPVEIGGAYIGGGKIIASGRNEISATDTSSAKANFQLTSSDYGATWAKTLSNIADTNKSTVSMVYDSATDALTAYYFDRNFGALKRRVTTGAAAFVAPLDWPDSEALAIGTRNGSDTGNANAVLLASGQHVAAYYSGDSSATGIYAVRP